MLDASIALAWWFDDESVPLAEATLDVVTERGGAAPQHWPLEVANGALIGMRRGRMTVERLATLAQDFRDVGVTLDDATAHHALGRTVELARRHALTVYDAAYLELAQRRGLPLATLDDALRGAAPAAGVVLFEP